MGKNLYSSLFIFWLILLFLNWEILIIKILANLFSYVLKTTYVKNVIWLPPPHTHTRQANVKILIFPSHHPHTQRKKKYWEINWYFFFSIAYLWRKTETACLLFFERRQKFYPLSPAQILGKINNVMRLTLTKFM